MHRSSFTQNWVNVEIQWVMLTTTATCDFALGKWYFVMLVHDFDIKKTQNMLDKGRSNLCVYLFTFNNKKNHHHNCNNLSENNVHYEIKPSILVVEKL